VANNSSSVGQQAPAVLDTSVPHAARVWNYWLGGKDNFAADREVGDQVRDVYPEIGYHGRNHCARKRSAVLSSSAIPSHGR